MGLAKIDVRYQTVLKDFKDTNRDRYHKELAAYQTLDWATPELKWHGEFWIEMERLIPILDLAPDQTRKYRDPLRDLLQSVHDAGYWHGDCALVNVVVHPYRGPLLIDWENLREASGTVSYDLYGARMAGVEPAWTVPDDDGVWWGGPWDFCPGQFWEDA